MRSACLRVLLLIALSGAAAVWAATPCEGLASLRFPDATITAAESIAASAAVPVHCRVAMVLKPSPDSHIEMEVWLPAGDWNGKFQAVGNGGWAGSISRPAMTAALRENYATASTDTGHKSEETPGGSFALGHSEEHRD